jgi:hypothetical protein
MIYEELLYFMFKTHFSTFPPNFDILNHVIIDDKSD